MNKHLLTLAVALAAAAAAPAAQATLIDAQFSGTVQSETNSGLSLGSAVSGQFRFDTDTGSFTWFRIGGRSVAAGFTSSAATTPDRYTALYTAQVSPVVSGGSVNNAFTLDLEGLLPWSTTDAAEILIDSAELATNLDSTLSHFGFYIANADGTDVQALEAGVDSVAAQVPEPGSLALVAAALAGAGLVARRRRG